MNTATRLLVFAGSTRAGSINRKLAAAAARMAESGGAQVTLLDLADHELPIYQGDLEARGFPAAALRLKEIFYTHEAWLIACPEYNGSYPALLKNTLDWASRPVPNHPQWQDGRKPFAGKVVGVLSASNGVLAGLRGQSHLLPLLMNLGAWVAPKQFGLAKADEAFDPDGQLATDAQRAGLRAVVDQVLWAAPRIGLPHAAP
jgi:NAD(P)H-dependent FMN reductase